MSLASAADLGDIEGGESLTFSLWLTPDETEAFGTYTGQIFVTYENAEGDTEITKPSFEFDLATTDTGGLRLVATDELTYFGGEDSLVENVIARPGRCRERHDRQRDRRS